MTLVTVVLSDGSRRELDITDEEAAKLRDQGVVPSIRSDLSGDKVNEDEKDAVLVTFNDGARRRLVLKDEEVKELKHKGRAVSGRFSRISSWYSSVPKAIRITLASVFIGALLTPAISRQFTDRQQESELKSRLSGQISTSSVNTIYSLRRLVLRQLPEFEASDEYCRLLEVNRTANNKANCESAETKAQRAAGKSRFDTHFRYTRDYLAIWYELAVFSEGDLRNAWTDYYRAITNLTAIAPGGCGAVRDQAVKDLQSYLTAISPGEYNDVVKNFGGETKPCVSKKGQLPRAYVPGDAGFLTTYSAVGDRLVHRALEIARDVQDAPTSRYSVGFRDFVKDVVTPFGSD